MRLKIWRGLSPVHEPAVPKGRSFESEIARLYEDEAPRLLRRLSKRLGPDAAGDVVQSAFVRLLRMGSEGVELVGRPSAYLNRVAGNLVKDDAKAARKRFIHVEIHSDERLQVGADPHAVLESRDLLRRIEAAIPMLPDRTRTIFIAHRFEHLTYAEIAARMEISVKTVEKHISIALRELHRAVQPSHDA